jgi:N-acetylmuramoyl-L-alanine amidase
MSVAGIMRSAGRIVVVMLLTAAFLVPALSSPARTILIPQTLARTRLLTQGSPTTTLSFSPTHIAFSWNGDERSGVRYRTMSNAGEMSDWKRAPEAHDAERGDRHFSGVLFVDRPIARVEYEPITPRGTWMGPVTLDYLNTVDGPTRAVSLPAVAHAAAETPSIVTRRQWGADEISTSKSGGCKRRFFPVQQLFVHHTAGKNHDPNPAATMRAIHWYHTVRQGWCDVGYNFVIAQDGTVFEGRWARKYAPWETHTSENLKGRAVVGAHVSGFNSGSVGVSVMGNFSRMKPPPAVRQSLAELLAWEADRHDLDPLARHTYVNPDTGARRKLMVISGHRAAGSTECPGNYLANALGAVRRDTAAVMGPGKASSLITLSSSTTQATPGQSVTYSGRLTDPSGLGLISRQVTVYQRGRGGRWLETGTLITGIDGSFQMTSQHAVTTVTRAVYDGDAGTWGAQSQTVRVVVSAAPSPTPTPTATSSG